MSAIITQIPSLRPPSRMRRPLVCSLARSIWMVRWATPIFCDIFCEVRVPSSAIICNISIWRSESLPKFPFAKSFTKSLFVITCSLTNWGWHGMSIRNDVQCYLPIRHSVLHFLNVFPSKKYTFQMKYPNEYWEIVKTWPIFPNLVFFLTRITTYLPWIIFQRLHLLQDIVRGESALETCENIFGDETFCQFYEGMK